MSNRSKKKIIYGLVIASIALNLLLLVNVFALKMVRRNYPRYIPVLESEKVVLDPKSAKPVLSVPKKNLMQVSYELAREYERKAQDARNLRDKTNYYSLALLEYAKLPKKDPFYVKLVREAKERIKPFMLEDFSVVINLGDRRKDVEQVYGMADYQEVDAKYLPSGIVTYEHYTTQGLVVGISNDRVFSIKLCSGFPGTWYGVKINDRFDKIATLYDGEKLDIAGNNFGYKVNDFKTTFIFVDSDDKLDGIEIMDKQYYGDWELALK